MRRPRWQSTMGGMMVAIAAIGLALSAWPRRTEPEPAIKISISTVSILPDIGDACNGMYGGPVTASPSFAPPSETEPTVEPPGRSPEAQRADQRR